ncbi:polysaccharide export protein [Jiella sp. MQZ9-1]|uniref:Polysaccharide export protein n=1 Tax=Jiella flava TaxID=2816857 RepID=A0A939JX75_9HYPH|nr:polysaccharide biosynthesis/export family protein [Jiella flava]MBO0663772.1 polysaccharide export protein [Jiella flava]MCD2472345.1 polysaccharide export protein [Jiella flava]
MKKIYRTFLAITALTLLPACASYHPVPDAFHAGLNQPYRLDSGDRLRVIVFGEDGLTNTYPVDKAGFVSLPLIGEVPARGRTAEQVQTEISQRYADGYLNKPNVTVQIEQYRPFFIMGEVTNGGQYSYVPGMTVQNAVAIAGGFTPRAEQENVDVTRQTRGNVLTGRVVASDPLMPGDTVYVRERWF